MNEPIGDINKILAGTEYEKSAPCIKKILDHYRIETLSQLDNGPKILGMRVCGHSVWELVSIVRERTLNPPPEPVKKPEPVVAREEVKPVIKKTPAKKVVETKSKKE